MSRSFPSRTQRGTSCLRRPRRRRPHRREWATFTTPGGVSTLLYWWQRDGVYYVVRLANGGPKFIGHFFDLDAAVAIALTVPPP